MTNEDKIIKNKLGVLRLADMLGNVSQACKVMGYSRDSFLLHQPLQGAVRHRRRTGLAGDQSKEAHPGQPS